MAPAHPSMTLKREQRVQAVLALLRGEPVAQVAVRFAISRSDLYKFRGRALKAMRDALADQRRGPKKPHNRLDGDREQHVMSLCARHPTRSSYRVREQLGSDAPSARTIQRIRARHGIARVPKRAPPSTPARRLSKRTMQRARHVIKEKPHLGPERLAWDLQNREHIRISPSTVKRLKRHMREALYPPAPSPEWRFYERHHPHSLWHGDFMEKVTLTDIEETAYQLTLQDDYSRGYVFCDLYLNPDQRDVIRAMIEAMRRWWVIPKAVIFDNGSAFKGTFISTFCKNLGIRLMHTTIRHPQTNGKLERAFRDDMKDFYRQYDAWHLEPLRRDLPDYVDYRNYVRGHQALGGKPSSTRLRERTSVASLDLLDGLESFACYEVGRKIIPPDGNIRMFDRNAYVGAHLAGVEVALVETLDGLEARVDDQCIGLLRNYRDMRQLPHWEWRDLPPVLYFENEKRADCPLNAVAL